MTLRHGGSPYIVPMSENKVVGNKSCEKKIEKKQGLPISKKSFWNQSCMYHVTKLLLELELWLMERCQKETRVST